MGKSTSKVTKRELEVLFLLSQGMKNSQLCEKLSLSESTIDTYKSHLKEKLNLKSTNELIIFSIKNQKKIKIMYDKLIGNNYKQGG